MHRAAGAGGTGAAHRRADEPEPFETVELEAARPAHRRAQAGVTLEEPFLQMAFVALPVIPHLKITDHGVVDV